MVTDLIAPEARFDVDERCAPHDVLQHGARTLFTSHHHFRRRELTASSQRAHLGSGTAVLSVDHLWPGDGHSVATSEPCQVSKGERVGRSSRETRDRSPTQLTDSQPVVGDSRYRLKAQTARPDALYVRPRKPNLCLQFR
jgi:hypothetical protein